MKRLILFLLFLIFCLVVLFSNTFSILLPWCICAIVVRKIYMGRVFKNIAILSYMYFSVMGAVAYYSYLSASGSTFAPFLDDNYYYNNIISLMNGIVDADVNYTAFELFMAVIAFPFKFVMPLYHYDFLPFNWVIGSLIVVESVRFASDALGVKSIYSYYMNSFFILLNYSCVDSVIHLYRDPLVILLFIMGIRSIYFFNIKTGAILSIIAAFVRGANGVLLFVYCFISKINIVKYLNKRVLYALFITSIFVFPFVDEYINYNMLGRITSVSNSVVNDKTISDRMYQFKEEDGGGGIMSLIRSENPFVNLLAFPAYMIAPVQVKSMYSNNEYLGNNGSYRFRIESVWEIIHIMFYVFMAPSLFIGLYFWLVNGTGNNLILSVMFLLLLISITYISMQVRHKMAFVILFPVLYNYYKLYADVKVRMYSMIGSFVFLIFIITYNIVL